jgi:hypothetical protein
MNTNVADLYEFSLLQTVAGHDLPMALDGELSPNQT